MAFAMQDASPNERDNARAWLTDRGLWPPKAGAPSHDAPNRDPYKPAPDPYTGWELWSTSWRAGDLRDGVEPAELLTAARRLARQQGHRDLRGMVMSRSFADGVVWVKVSGLVPPRDPFGHTERAARDFEAQMDEFDRIIRSDSASINRMSESLRQQAEAARTAAAAHRHESPGPGTKARTSFIHTATNDTSGSFLGRRKEGTTLDDVAKAMRGTKLDDVS